MPVPSSITDCNSTAANNSPAGSDSIGTSLDDYLRSHAAILRQVYDALVAVDATLLPKAGGTVTGTITTTHQVKGITPVAAEDLARKDYVDGKVVTSTSWPTFGASASANQVIAVGTWTKLAFDTEGFDTNTNYAPASARFTPTVAGYYQVNCSAKIDEISVSDYGANLSIDKNATTAVAVGVGIGDDNYKTGFSCSGIVYMNGSTDYLEAFVQPLGPSGSLAILGINFSASMVRPA